MTHKLAIKEMESYSVEFDGLEPDQQIHVDHKDCPTGDTKRRLYIRKKTDGNHRHIFYCQHCGATGVLLAHPETASIFTSSEVPAGRSEHDGERTHGLGKRDFSRHSVKTGGTSGHDRGDKYRLVNNEYNPQKFPIRARHWLNRYGITKEEITQNAISFNHRSNRLALPWFNPDGLCMGHQQRRIFSEDCGPKYLTYKTGDYPCYHRNINHSRRLVFVEDMLSSIVCSRYISSIALLTTTLSYVHLNHLIDQGHKEFIVFLDDDNATVCRNQVRVKKLLELYGTCKIIHGTQDPKELSHNQLMGLLLDK